MILRFLLIGAYNTVIGYMVFLALNWFFNKWFHYLMILIFSYILSVTHAYLTQRFLVFKSKGAIFYEYRKFFIVNLFGLGVNAVMLTLFIRLGFKVEIAQAIAVLIATIISYVGHKNFSFRPQALSKKVHIQ